MQTESGGTPGIGGALRWTGCLDSKGLEVPARLMLLLQLEA